MLNGTNQYIFNIYHYLLNLRDTMEYTIDREHKKELYENRKNVLINGLAKGSALGNFLENNKEQGDKVREKLNQVIDDFYGEGNNVIKVTEDGSVRVDHTQHIKIFDEIVGVQESVRDIVYGYLNYARQQNQSDEEMIKLMALDEKMTRVIIAMLVMREFEKSFGEFQKVMNESKGQPTPQSNFIVQNEIAKMANLIRFSRGHAHCTDNETLDLLDDVEEVIQMTEGRRDRRDNKPFSDFFNDINRRLNEAVAKLEPQWKAVYEKLFKEMVELSNKQRKDSGEQA